MCTHLGEPYKFELGIARSAMGTIAHVTDSEGKVRVPPEEYQSLSGVILPHFDINNLSVAQKLKKLEIGPFHLEL